MNEKRIGVFFLIILILSFCLGLSPLCFAAGSCTFTMDRPAGLLYTKLQAAVWSWTSDASGNVSSVGESIKLSGIIRGARFVPGSGVTDLYDVTLIDGNSFDILGGRGANLSSTASNSGNYRTPLTVTDSQVIAIVNATLTPVVSNAGAAKTGTIYLYFDVD